MIRANAPLDAFYARLAQAKKYRLREALLAYPSSRAKYTKSRFSHSGPVLYECLYCGQPGTAADRRTKVHPACRPAHDQAKAQQRQLH